MATVLNIPIGWNLIGVHKHLTVTCLKNISRSAGRTCKIMSYNVMKKVNGLIYQNYTLPFQ